MAITEKQKAWLQYYENWFLVQSEEPSLRKVKDMRFAFEAGYQAAIDKAVFIIGGSIKEKKEEREQKMQKLNEEYPQ